MKHVCPPEHRHHTSTTCYHDHQCRCQPCTAHMSARARERYRQKAYGRYEGRTNTVGTIRRYQGLQVLGWRAEDIAQQAGYSAPAPLLRLLKHKYITPETRDRIAAACDELVRLGRGPSDVTVRRAQRKGWVSVLAWDDIDTDPEPVPGNSSRMSMADIVAEIEHLVSLGESAEQVVKALGRRADTLTDSLYRVGRTDLAAFISHAARRAA